MGRGKHSILAMLSLAIISLGLTACGGDEATGTNPDALSGPPPPAPTGQDRSDAETLKIAMDLWRDDTVSEHSKGSCSGCHGPDFFDLARIGSTREDIIRRAEIDGATQDEATALADAVKTMRVQYQMPETDARQFRPFQPGGALIAEFPDDPSHIAAVKRDIVFGHQLERLLPTLFGRRISTLAEAQNAQAEMLDILRGTDEAGANPDRLNLRLLKTGIRYPLWSADIHHGPQDGTLNDWVADIGHDAHTDDRAEWIDIQDAYLAAPTRTNFWLMYKAAEDLTDAKPLGECSYEGINAHLACEGAKAFNRQKMLTVLIGQHRLRAELGLADPLEDGALAYSYIDTDPALSFMMERHNPNHLPANLWEVGDRARVMLDNSNAPGSLPRLLQELGYPQFAIDSVNDAQTAKREQHALRTAWFWIGFTHDPSFARIHGSNSTKSGEYMVASLLDENMHLHNSFAANMRIIAKGSLPEANVGRFDRRAGYIERVTPAMRLNYSYFVGYNRTILRWKEDSKAGILVPQSLQDEQTDLWHRFTANAFRMGLHLYLSEVESGATATDVPTDPIKVNFDRYQPEHRDADYALLNRVRSALGEPAYD